MISLCFNFPTEYLAMAGSDLCLSVCEESSSKYGQTEARYSLQSTGVGSLVLPGPLVCWPSYQLCPPGPGYPLQSSPAQASSSRLFSSLHLHWDLFLSLCLSLSHLTLTEQGHHP